MKIAITAAGDGWEAPVDERFGRAAAFAVIDLDVDPPSLTTVSNEQNRQAAQGAGIQAADNVAKSGVGIVVTGHVGPKAFRALAAGKIEVYTGVRGTVRQAFEDFQAGSLNKAAGSDVEGHW